MKVSIGTNIKDGPWGGGNLFAINLKNFLLKEGHSVCTTLDDKDIDLILITEPRLTSESSAFTDTEVLSYLKNVNEKTVVVHRINECDERKNTDYVNKSLIKANKVADHTVFVSSWLKKLFVDQGLINDRQSVILGGADEEIFNKNDKKSFVDVEKFKVVTHHWGNNWNKGFDIYSKFDRLLSEESWSNRFEFNYIGNIPKDFKFKNANYYDPLSGIELAKKLKENHFYLTASLNEPSGNHHIEAAQCGLPILYINSGGIPEYCENFGIEFDDNNFIEKLNEMADNYSLYLKKMDNYPFNSNQMCKNYLDLFKKLVQSKETLSKERVLPKISYRDMILVYIKKFYKKFR